MVIPLCQIESISEICYSLGVLNGGLFMKTFYMEAGWTEVLKEEFEKPYMKKLQDFLKKELKSNKTIYPPADLIFNAFCQTPYNDVKVVIMGQDPYHGKNQSHGLSFSIPENITVPPSLKNIFKEIMADVGIKASTKGCLLSWAKQGVLLLNATLTVEEAKPKSHYGKGWEIFTDKIIEILSNRKDPIVFLLWGQSAKEKFNNILKDKNINQHLVLFAAHPSFYSVKGFFGCKHFSKTNEFLKRAGKKHIDWQIL